MAAGGPGASLRVEAERAVVVLKIVFDAKLQIVVERDFGNCRVNRHLELGPVESALASAR